MNINKKISTRTSKGIILCRKRAVIEILLTKRRYTYAYCDFVHGHYSYEDANVIKSSHTKPTLLDDMTHEELLDIWSLNFEQMWYRIWLTQPNKELYNRKNARFQSTFMKDDAGVSLRRAISSARSNEVKLWVIPKGKKTNQQESDIMCAIRELEEETGVCKKDYKILPGIKRTDDYISSKTRYISDYYVAIAGPKLTNQRDNSSPTLRNMNTVAETSESRWFTREDIKLLDGAHHRLTRIIGPTFTMVKKYLNNKWDSSRLFIPPIL